MFFRLIKMWVAVLAGVTLVTGCSHAEEAKKELKIADTAFEIVGDLEAFTISVDTETVTDGLDIIEFVLRSDKKATPPAFSIKWTTPSVNIAGKWTPAFNEDHILPADWSSRHLESMATRNAPVVSLFGHDDVNRMTFAASDAMNFMRLYARIREEDGLIYNQIDLFSEPHAPVNEYRLKLRLDQRDVHLAEALSDVANWWADMPEYKPAHVPADARDPMYSTWYSYHQEITHEELVREMDASAKIGFKAIIVDDGWQTNDSNRGYAYTGDWKPERLQNMKQFVQDAHDRDMKALLWYSLPFVGEKSDAVSRFEGKFLSHWESQGTYVLDPRYPEVREFLIGHYVKAVRDWGWDGLKLDFIDQFRVDENTLLTAEDGRDYASVYEAVDRLMVDVLAALQAENPEVMVEFRQRYIGPLMRKYGNMFRATDIPNGAITNRKRIVNLRMLSGNTAVHSDMIMWHRDEPAEVAALQLLNIMFSVPQVSVRLEDIPADHLKMVAWYTGYWSENRDVLLDGKFRPKGVTGQYPLVKGIGENKTIVALYSDEIVSIGEAMPAKLDVINAKLSDRVILDVDVAAGLYSVTVRNHLGDVVSETDQRIDHGPLAYVVPPSGLLSLVRK